MSEQTLLVFAHSDEATAFAKLGVPHVVTGVGKINATLGLVDGIAQSLGEDGLDEVVVLGTAGVVGDGDARLSLEKVYQIRAVVQHDFSLDSPELVPGGGLLEGVETAVIATGDVFVKSDEQRERIAALGAALVDMESYAYASVCEHFEVPLRVFKVPSDFADSGTTDEDWDGIVLSKSDQLLQFVQQYLPELLEGAKVA